MANFPADPYPHLPPGFNIIPPSPHRVKRSYVILGGDLPVICDDWSIALLGPAADAHEFQASAAMIEHFLKGKGWRVRDISCCRQGAALVQFVSVTERDAAIGQSPHFIGDVVLRFVEQNRGNNHRDAVFTHECWLMLLNYPQECWELETVIKTMVPYGRFIVWNKDVSNKTRILVKIRPYNIDTLPLSIVVMHNSSDHGHGDSWTCLTYILSSTLLGALGGDEDPIPPGDINPHPMPMGFDDIWAGGHGHGHAANAQQHHHRQVNQQPMQQGMQVNAPDA
ncbi:hypothetical protein ACQ4PT_001119 [Festuca glaucescens]